jgi:hypothetical protein
MSDLGNYGGFLIFILGIVMIKQKSNWTDFKTNHTTTHITCQFSDFTSFLILNSNDNSPVLHTHSAYSKIKTTIYVKWGFHGGEDSKQYLLDYNTM